MSNVTLNTPCNKCGHHTFYMKKQGSNTGLYCWNCGKWQKWLNKDEVRLYEEKENDSIEAYKKVRSNHYYDDDTKERLNRFLSFLNQEIDKEYSKMPITVEDSVRKNTYCMALDKCQISIENILAGREFNEMGEEN